MPLTFSYLMVPQSARQSRKVAARHGAHRQGANDAGYVGTGQDAARASALSKEREAMFKRTAWPSGHWGSMHISGGVSAAYRRVIDESDDPDKTRREIEAKLDALASPFKTAESFNIEDIMDPRDTRPMLCEFVEMAQSIIATQLGPTSVPYMP